MGGKGSGRPEPALRGGDGRYSANSSGGGGGWFGCLLVFALPGLVGLADVLSCLVG